MSNLPNWFANDGQENFAVFVKSNPSNKSARLLQIGAYTGDASLWMYENILKNSDSVLIDVDTWEGSNETAHHEMNWETVESVYDLKTSEGRLARKIVKYKGTSDSFFKNNVETYDFIYIDGDHTAYGVIKDAINAYECLKPNGIIGFDDYQWVGAVDPADRPAMAINSFLEIYKNRVEVLTSGYQLWIRKKG